MLITENELDTWVSSHSEKAPNVLADLISRLVAVSCEAWERRFPAGDSINQRGMDGFLNARTGFEPFFPEGKSCWEYGTNKEAGDKATEDYKNRTETEPKEKRQQSEFIFVTPRSAKTTFPYTWKGQLAWIKKRQKKKDWKGVRVIDGTQLVDWIHHFPAVERWLAGKMGCSAKNIETIEEHWKQLQSSNLLPEVFLSGRRTACEKLQEVLNDTCDQLQFDTHFFDQIPDFISAYIYSLNEENRKNIENRCLIISGQDDFSSLLEFIKQKHIFILNFGVDSKGAKLIQKAIEQKHSVIWGDLPGGESFENQVQLPSKPEEHLIKKSLEKNGYTEEETRKLIAKSAGNLSSLVRQLKGLSTPSEWSKEENASELALAMLLSSWRDDNENDRAIVEKLVDKTYSKWIKKLDNNFLLIRNNNEWKIQLRYETWFALGLKISDRNLDCFKDIAISVLSENNPEFEWPADQRYAANVHLKYSEALRCGIAESLALLGSYPEALCSKISSGCTTNKIDDTVLAVREILKDSDWRRWAGLNHLLPLMAEAAPKEFLSIVEKNLSQAPCPFDEIFSQGKPNSITGQNYAVGLLWALELLAWNEEYLVRVLLVLGKLAPKNMDANWSNRPINSLKEILLPWPPQTYASIAKKKMAVEALLKEVPEIGWKVLMGLLPEGAGSSAYTYKPIWREWTPPDWSGEYKRSEYLEQINNYIELILANTNGKIDRVIEVVEKIENISWAFDKVLAWLNSSVVLTLSEEDKAKLSECLTKLVIKHRKYSKYPEAVWVIREPFLEKIEAVINNITPSDLELKYRILFNWNDFDLHEETGNSDEQFEKLQAKRRQAISEILSLKSMESVKRFAQAVELSYAVGFALGCILEEKNEDGILPELLESSDEKLSQFCNGYVRGKLKAHHWSWFDNLKLENWTCDQIGQWLAFLPFTEETWKRAEILLHEKENFYWTKTYVNPDMAKGNLETAVNQLLKYKRPFAAISCLTKIVRDKKALNTELAARALLDAIESKENGRSQQSDVYEISEVIRTLQNNPETSPENLFNVEWAYLPLMAETRSVRPKLLEQRLADDPKFFCKIIQIIFKPKNIEVLQEEITEDQKKITQNAYRLLYEWKIPPGKTKSGVYDGQALHLWLENVKTECNLSGHLQVTLEQVGQVLFYAPSDPDGLWLHRAVAEELNKDDAENMRQGFKIASLNSRGTYTPDPSGKAEQQIADRYKNKAEQLETAGYHRLGAAIREIADEYERESKQLILGQDSY